MTEKKKKNEESSPGSPIYRYNEYGNQCGAPAEGLHMEAVSNHIEKHLGSISQVFHELVSDTVHIDIHQVEPTEDWPFHVLVTSGMSDLPMTVPDEFDAPRYIELMLTLPASWQLDEESFKEETWYWPIRTLKFLARFPHKYNTWLGWGHTIPNGDPAKPYADNTELNGVILLPPVSTPEEFHTLTIDNREISFLSVLPLFEEEMNFKLKHGTDPLLKKLDKHDITDIIDLQRKNVGKKKFGIF